VFAPPSPGYTFRERALPDLSWRRRRGAESAPTPFDDGKDFATRLSDDVLIREGVQSRAIGHETPDGTDMLCALDVGQERVAAADHVTRVFEAWRFRAWALIERRLDDTGGNDSAVVQVEELRNNAAATLA
jgi:hypothetical protein